MNSDALLGNKPPEDAVEPQPAMQQQARTGFLTQAAQAKGRTQRLPKLALAPRWLAPALAVMLLLLVAGTTVVPTKQMTTMTTMTMATTMMIERRDSLDLVAGGLLAQVRAGSQGLDSSATAVFASSEVPSLVGLSTEPSFEKGCLRSGHGPPRRHPARPAMDVAAGHHDKAVTRSVQRPSALEAPW
jgi:hypothetical protein